MMTRSGRRRTGRAAGTRSSPSPTSASTSVRLRARPRSAGARQQRLFPRPRRADAPRGAVCRHLLAQGRRRPRRDGLPPQDRQAWRDQELALHPSEGPHRRQHRLRGRPGGDGRGERGARRGQLAGLLHAGGRRARPTATGRNGAEAALGLLARLVRRPAKARSARARPAGTARGARRKGPHRLDRAARPARRASAGRGLS